MKVVIQRVSQASVTIDSQIKSAIGVGLLVLLGIQDADTSDDVIWLSSKIVNLRIFNDSDEVMNLSLKDINGELMLISQFTLYASTKKGNRPSYIKSARPETAIPLYEQMIVQLQQELQKTVHTGTFGADMKVSILNNGPVTIIIDTENKV